MRNWIGLLALSLAGCGGAVPDTASGCRGLTVLLLDPHLVFDPPEMILPPTTATVPASRVALLRNQGDTVGSVAASLAVSDDRVLYDLFRTTIPPGGVAELSLRFVAPSTATLDATIITRGNLDNPCEAATLRLHWP